MVKTLKLRDMLAASDAIGLDLDRCTEGGNLYAWHTSDDDVLYIGKAASNKRHDEEDSWVELDHTERIYSGFIPLIRANKGVKQRLNYEPERFDPQKTWAVLDRHQWEGPALDTLRAALTDGYTPTVENVEQFLIRVAVRCGALIGNSRDASQWEAPIGKVTDTLAHQAVLTLGGDPETQPPPPVG